MESDRQYYHQHQQTQRQTAPGLARYQSAPSSYFSSLTDGGFNEFFNRPASPETERIFQRFLQSTSSSVATGQNSGTQPKAEVRLQIPKHGAASQVAGYASQCSDNSQSRQQFDMVPNVVGGSNSNLIRHSSSPAGLLNTINIKNGYVAMEGARGFEPTNNTAPFHHSSKTTNPWMKEESRERRPSTGGLDLPKDESKDSDGTPPPLLVHQLSLPTSSSEKSAMEKMLQFSDAVPCKVRAKRGCATHPRSIAERMRRTRISEKLKKLQDLVPNMDKQTNTSDMLDMAVDYIQDLQNQLKVGLHQTQSLNQSKRNVFFISGNFMFSSSQ